MFARRIKRAKFNFLDSSTRLLFCKGNADRKSESIEKQKVSSANPHPCIFLLGRKVADCRLEFLGGGGDSLLISARGENYFLRRKPDPTAKTSKSRVKESWAQHPAWKQDFIYSHILLWRLKNQGRMLFFGQCHS